MTYRRLGEDSYLHFKVKLNLKNDDRLTKRMEIENLKRLPWEMEKLHKARQLLDSALLFEK